jgi:phosphoglycerol transferase MdoB-like AlkP superfamily enzyme
MSRFSRFGPPRYLVLVWVAGLFLAISVVTRLGLLIFEAEPDNFLPWRAASILGVGFLYDLATTAFVLVPGALIALFFPAGPIGRKAYAWVASALLLVGIFAMLCIAVAEALFWNEFSSRFNFIAVDYLIYTRETLGNIRESYPVGAMLASTAMVAALCFLAVRRPIWRAAAAEGGAFSQRLLTTLAILALPIASLFLIGDGPRDALPSASSRELAGNGYYDFVRAFRSNDLDYKTFYRTIADADAERQLRQEFEEARSTAVFATNGSHPLERQVTASGPAKPLNVVLVTIESLGSDYVQSFGGKPGLTPNLDRIGAEGLRFTELYATGTRTVRGLEALTLSVPPTPGHAVPVRINNKGFQTLGGIFKDQGYEPLFIYGGYSYFDNMNDFFGGNGYTVIDRTSLDRSDVSHETIWGVADEDLFKLATREIDARWASGRKVFAQVMTTSNHRPYTYPEGRIDIPSKSGRDGAVKYTDWAIGNFIKEASTRPWFKDTLFVFIADHTSHSRGPTDLPPENYRIPMIVYAPGMISPGTIDTLASQIDVGPTILGLLNVSYTSRFFGQDILREGQHHQRALMANYLTVGHMENGAVVELSTKRRARVLDAKSGRELPADNEAGIAAIEEAISYYQVADRVLRGR